MRVVQMSGLAALIENIDEDDGEVSTTWVFCGNVPPDAVARGQWSCPANVHPSQWQDWWGPFHPNQLTEFIALTLRVDREAASPHKQLEVVQRAGFQDMGAYFWVRHTFLKNYGQADAGDPLDHYVWGDRCNQALANAAMLEHQANIAQVAAADTGLLAPVEGVTLETYAQMSATQAQGLDQAAFMQLLQQHGMDYPKWERVSQGWMAKMSTDGTGTIASVYGKAFMGAGQGQFGAAAQQSAGAMGAMGGFNPGAPGGQEPISFDRYCEIAGAMNAWSETGQDVNAMMQKTFGMTALDYSTVSTWWMQKMMAQMEMFETYQQKMEAFTARYRGQAAPNPDADIEF